MGKIKEPRKHLLYQYKLFLISIVISGFTLIIVLFSSSPKQNDIELKEYLKVYMDSTTAVIQKEISNTSIEVFDIIYGDTNIINNRRNN